MRSYFAIGKGENMAKLNSDDFINIYDYADEDYPFQIFIGGRGVGKTYSALSGAVGEECANKFIFMRRTGNELDILLDSDSGEGVNPFKPINKDFGRNIGMRKIVKNMAGIYERETEPDTGKLIHVGAPLGYGVALSTLSSIRGVDFSDCTDWIYDEFIPEKHVRKIHGECDALLNAYETVNRNREFSGEPPIRLWLLANSNDIYNPIFVGLGIVSEAEKMLRQGKVHKYLKERGLAIHILPPKESFKEKKAQTALYKLTKGTSFYDMSLGNQFAYNDFSLIGYRKLVGYTPVCSIDNAFVYRKKGDNEYYISYATARCPAFKTAEAQDVIRFRQQFGCMLQPYFVAGRLYFESYELKEKILNLIL